MTNTNSTMTSNEKAYLRWCEKVLDSHLRSELEAMRDDAGKIDDAFYRNLDFGTGGLRGIMGVGTNRMNIYTVAGASQGLANYVIKNFPADKRLIAIAYDSRNKSDVFARVAASVFAANSIKTQIFSSLMPTPCLSYAVRALSCAAGVVITASHNPSEYNGYKVYGADGCQITTEAAKAILGEIEKIDVFDDVKRVDYATAAEDGMISFISEDVVTDFVDNVKNQSVLFGDNISSDVSIVYSPLCGAGLKTVLRTLRESGFDNVSVVKEQEQPDGNFPTCPFPNPEIKEAMSLGIEYAKKYNADLLLATDPDCDRVGIAVRDKNGAMTLLSGNETGLLLFDYIASQRARHGKMPSDAVLIKTIVTTPMAERIAQCYGVRVINVLTGFKFIGEQIGILEKLGKRDSYIFGFEESYGYLSGSYVRDKDAVNGAFLICEMFAYYKSRGISLIDKLCELYKKYGYFYNTLHFYTFEGSSGFDKMQTIMQSFRGDIKTLGTRSVLSATDYGAGVDGLPKSNVIKFHLEGDSEVIVRPSGTEPKMKTYISVCASDMAEAKKEEARIKKSLDAYII